MKACPSCATALDDKTVDRFTAEVCPGCGGIWFPVGQFAEMMHDADLPSLAAVDKGPAEHASAHTPTVCVDCGQSLSPFHYTETSILLYRCDACGGIFLPFQQLQPLKNRQLALFDGYVRTTDAPNLSPEVREAVATLDAMRIGDEMRAHNFIQTMQAFDRPWGWY